MTGLKPPGNLSLQGNIAQNYKDWYRMYDIYAIATGVAEKAEKVQCNVFLHVAGPAAQKVYATMTFSETEKDKIKPLIKQFTEYCQGKRNITVIRYHFNTSRQKDGESFDTYLTDLRNKIRDCEYGDLEDSLLRDRIVGGVRDETLREKLLQTEKLDITKCMDLCRLSEISASHLKASNEQTVQQVKQKWRKGQGRGNPNGKQFQTKPPSKYKGKGASTETGSKCRNCGGRHRFTPREACPAYQKQCHACGKINHFQSVCLSTKRATQRRVQEIETIYQRHPQFAQDLHDVLHGPDPPSETDSEDELFIGEILAVGEISKAPWTKTFVFENHPVCFKLDTGSEANIMPFNDFQKLHRAQLRSTNIKLVSYSGHKIIPCGEATLQVNGNRIRFQVVKGVDPILGRDTCKQLGLVKRIEAVSSKPETRVSESLVSEFQDVFTGLGCITTDCHLYTDPSVEPVIDPPRRIPYAIRDQVKAELERMENLGVIVRETKPTPWVNSMTIVQKPNKIRVCLDPTKLNKAIQRSHHPTKTVEEVAASMPNATIMSSFDASCGFWQIGLDEESSKLCTFNTPWGRYRFTRLPFGISTSGDIFNQVMSEIFRDIDGVEIVVDDILVHASSAQEHDRRVRQMLQRARESKLTLNPKKAKVGLTEIEYVGHVISKDGLKPSRERVKAVVDMPTPQCKEDVQRFTAMLGYLQKFIPNLSKETKPLREILAKNVAWHWDERHDAAFEKLKNLVTSTPVLKLYDVTKPIRLQVDASKSGIGAVAIQDGHPIAYGSKALDDTQAQYAVIEKELLAICFGCKKFHDYVFGKPVIIETDHKPLLGVMSKPLHMLSARMQRMRMRLQRYDLHLVYKPGKEMFIADTLSRAYLNNTKPNDLFDDTIEVNVVQISDQKLQEFRESTARDPALQCLKQAVLHGWPECSYNAPSEIKPYFAFRDEITYESQLLFKGSRLIVPINLRSDMLKRIHESHMGIVKSKQLARDIIFWPGMGAQIEDVIARCSTCQANRKSQASEPMISHDIPGTPWAKVATDLFHYKGRDYVVCVDYFSKYPEISLLPDTSSYATITALKSIFSKLGIPQEIISDNGPQYSSRQFQEFAETWDFKHTTSSPAYPQSNGQAERTVQTVKNLLKKCDQSGEDPYIALLNYRNAPLDGIGKSPAQLLMSRRLRSRLPTSDRLLKPQVVQSAHTKLAMRQKDQKHYYDLRAGNNKSDLQPGEKVRFQSPKGKWEKGHIQEKNHGTPRSYKVVTPSGKIFRRNRCHMFVTKESIPKYSTPPQTPMVNMDNTSQKNTPVVPPIANTNDTPIVNTNDTSVLKDALVEPNVSHDDSVTNLPDTTRVTTRSGRLVKPVIRLNI